MAEETRIYSLWQHIPTELALNDEINGHSVLIEPRDDQGYEVTTDKTVFEEITEEE